MGSFIFPTEQPAAIPRHRRIPSYLILLLQSGHIVMKSFILIITRSFYVLKKEAEVWHTENCVFCKTCKNFHASLWIWMLFDVHWSVHHNINYLEITNKMRPRIRILLFKRFLLLNMFWATHRLSSGAQKLYLQPLVYIRLWLPAADSGRQSQTYVNQRLQIQFLSSWWWAMCRWKHVEQ